MSNIIQTILFSVILIIAGLYIVNIPTTPSWLAYGIGITCIGGGIVAGITILRR